MSGGKFLMQTKTRPGAYINFKSVAKQAMTIGSRGIVTLPVPMSWGPAATVITLYSTDLVDGKSLAKIGCVASDSESLIFRQALANCATALIYRIDTGGTKAVGTLGNLTATAKYAGTVGNDVKVIIVEEGILFRVHTYYKNVEIESQLVATIAALVSNDFVDFSGSSALAANAGVTLTTGTNGTVSVGTYTTYLAAMKGLSWNTMGIPSTDASLQAEVKAYILSLRDTSGKKVQAVMYDYDEADYEGIISVDDGFSTDTETITNVIFVAYMAGLTAGSNANQSNTFRLIGGAVSITTPKSDAAIILALAAGKLVLSTRQDGGIVIEQDINTFHTFVETKGYEMSKNRIIRTLDEVNNGIKIRYENSYIGKVDNNADGRNLFKADIIQFMNSLQKIGAITDFAGVDDVQVEEGSAIDAVIAYLAVQPVDAMEKLYMTVLVG